MGWRNCSYRGFRIFIGEMSTYQCREDFGLGRGAGPFSKSLVKIVTLLYTRLCRYSEVAKYTKCLLIDQRDGASCATFATIGK